MLVWQEVVRHLSLEWSVNAQYRFGWLVPFLCLYLLWRNAGKADSAAIRGDVTSSFGWNPIIMTVLLAGGYAPIRVVAEANPDWRLVSWALALEAVGLTLVFVSLLSRSGAGRDFGLPARGSAFPILFFLSAVPWPTVIERPVVEGLTRIVTLTATEVLGAWGVPAICHGNLIELGSGTVGVDEACSGIRSVQVCLMLSLFFGEFYRLPSSHRLLVILLGLMTAVGLNATRTTLLAWVTAQTNLQSMKQWHDLTGFIIPAAGFAGVWLGALWLRPAHIPKSRRDRTSDRTDQPKFLSTLAMPAALALWFASVEIGTECWFRFNEARLPPPLVWEVALPFSEPGFRKIPFGNETERILRFDQGVNAVWSTPGGLKWQAIFLQWNPGRIAAHLARNHTPRDCLPAAGKHLTREPATRLMSVKGLELPFRCYIFKEGTEPVFVFYCLWEDRAVRNGFDAEWLTYANRLKSVLAGERNRGQRSLELALRGAETETAAHAAFEATLKTIIVGPE